MTDTGDTQYRCAPTATVSSVKSQDSTEQLIQATPPDGPCAESAPAPASTGPGWSGLAWSGLAQVALGAALAGAGAGAAARGAGLARLPAGLAGGAAGVLAGLLGLLAAINHCRPLSGLSNGPLLTAYLAVSLLNLALSNAAAVLAATGLHRDYLRAGQGDHDTFENEMQAWTPVMANITLLIISTVDCLLCAVVVCGLSRRVCPCFRPRRPYDLNQFEPGKTDKSVTPYVVSLEDEKKSKALCKDLETRIQGDEKIKRKEEVSRVLPGRETLVSSWLTRHPAPRPPPLYLLPARPLPSHTLGRMPVGVMMPPPRYATLPLPPYPPPLYYPVHDPRVRRRRSPRESRAIAERRRARRDGRSKESRLTRSLERIHRKRRAERDRLSDAELKRTYTGLDRAYAEQFIAVCDESRSHAADHSESLTSTASSDSRDTQPQPF